VDLDDLVGAGEIAARLTLAHVSTVHTLFRRHADFPRPVKIIGQNRIWLWPEVEAWAVATGRLKKR